MKRMCGACTACCTAYDVPGIPQEEPLKPSGRPCMHVQEVGCTIYDNRPPTCRDYQCSWLLGEHADRERPDMLGVIFDYRTYPIPGWYVREVSDVLSESDSRANKKLARLKMRMYKLKDNIQVVSVTRWDGTQLAYLPDGTIERNPEKVQPIIQLRKK